MRLPSHRDHHHVSKGLLRSIRPIQHLLLEMKETTWLMGFEEPRQSNDAAAEAEEAAP